MNINVKILIISIFINSFCSAQNKKKSDSLKFFLQTHQQGGDSILFEANRKLGFYHPVSDSALFYSFKALEIANRLNSNINTARALELIGVNNRLLGNKKAGFEASYAALKIYDRLELSIRQASLHLQIGEHLVEDENYEPAIIQLKKSVVDFDSLGDEYRMILALINLGETYRLNENLRIAKETFLKVLKMDILRKKKMLEGYTKGNLGLTYQELGNLDSAKSYLIRAIEVLSKFSDMTSISVYQAALGEIHIEQGEAKKGEQELLEALEIAESENLKKQIRDISATLSNHYSTIKQFQKAYIYQKQFQLYQDSLVNVPNVRKIEEIKSEYALNKKDIENEKLALENRQKKSELLFTIIAVLLLSILIVIVYYAYRNKQKSNRTLQGKNDIITSQVKEKELLHKEIHHRVKNNLQLIGSIMGLQSQTSDNEELSAAMSISKSRVEAMTIIHQNLFSEDHKVQINLSEYLEKLVANLKSTYQDQIESIEVNSIVFDVIADDAIPIGLIINEAVCNAVKYKGDQNLRVEIDFSKSENGYVLRITDNGPGLSKDENQRVGFGTKLISTLARQLRAELKLDSNSSGTSIQLLLKEMPV